MYGPKWTCQSCVNSVKNKILVRYRLPFRSIQFIFWSILYGPMVLVNTTNDRKKYLIRYLARSCPVWFHVNDQWEINIFFCLLSITCLECCITIQFSPDDVCMFENELRNLFKNSLLYSGSKMTSEIITQEIMRKRCPWIFENFNLNSQQAKRLYSGSEPKKTCFNVRITMKKKERKWPLFIYKFKDRYMWIDPIV